MSIAIRFENVSKQYRLGEIGTGTISRDIERAWAKFRGRPDPTSTIDADQISRSSGAEYVWAVRDLSLDVVKGEVFGIIGRNGAGKSTLLKLLSRVTAPTHGTIRANGTLASLLEVGTGFHPELTGRENVLLNGAILGMSRADTRTRIDEIVDFSGCAKHIDTPIKRYSSGMIVRLGFSVAAHLNCDTLVIDEVLAVGDMDFRQRCIEKMQDVTASGRTILLVSHNMTTMARLCDRCAILDQGSLDFVGDTSTAINRYSQKNVNSLSVVSLDKFEPRSGSQRVRFEKFWIEDDSGQPIQSIASGDTINFCFSLRSRGGIVKNVDVGFSIHELSGDVVTGLYSTVTGQQYDVGDEPRTVRCCLDNLALPEGRFAVAVRMIAHAEELDWPRGMIASFDVVDGDFYGHGRSNYRGNLKFLISGNWSDSTRWEAD